jgi:hypothetical protein
MTVYSAVAFALAAVFGLIGGAQLVGPAFVRDAYKDWDLPDRIRLATGGLDIAAALMLTAPALRVWGVVLAGILTFGSVVLFITHRQYRWAFTGALLMAGLVPATLAVPRDGDVRFIVQEKAPSRPASERNVQTPPIALVQASAQDDE